MKNYVDKDKLQEYTTKLTAKNKTIFATKAEVGSPLVAASVAEMTDTNKIYVYVGSESGYTSGNWYYYNGSDWVSGGIYNAVAFETDTTLTQAGMAADAKATGDAIALEKNALNDVKDVIFGKTFTTVNTELLKSGWRQGYYKYEDGTVGSSSNYIRYINNPNTNQSNGGFYIDVPTGYDMRVLFYNSASDNYSYANNYTPYVSGPNRIEILVPPSAAMRFNMRRTASGALSPEDVPNVVINRYNFDVTGYQKIHSESALADNTDLNDLFGKNSVWFIDSSRNYAHMPPNISAGVLMSFAVRNHTLQLYYSYTSLNIIFKRYGTSSGWSDWLEISGGGDSVTIEQIYNQYSDTNTYNVSPSITTGENNYLASTGDSSDVSGSILALLSTTGICNLGPGVFYVSGVDMPDDTSIVGSGPATKIILLGEDTSEGYAIKLGNRCTIKDCSILGNNTDKTSNSVVYPSDVSIVARHGIIWQGTYNYDTGSGTTKQRGTVTNCHIANFTGGGIACYQTGIATMNGLHVSDCIIWYCYAGIYIPLVSEFNSFNNVKVNKCYLGALCNGGNNLFANCNFSANRIGFMIDNTGGAASNNSHGSVSNCIFDHSGGNTGIGIKLIGVTYGEIFTGCQLFFSGIELTNCNGVIFEGLNAGRFGTSGNLTGVPITISGGSLIMFNGCGFQLSPSISVTNNTKVKFNNCYTWSGTQVTN